MYTGVFNVGGGATMDYSKGSITTDLIGMGALMAAQGAYTTVTNPSLKASSMYLTSTIGGSYAMSDGFSMSMAVRYISAKNTAKAAMTLGSSPIDLDDMTMNLNTEDNATGWGGVFSMNVTAFDRTCFSLRYESQIGLNFKTKQVTDDFGLTVDGSTHRRDLPAVLAFGASYAWTPKLKMFADWNYYFQENADWGKSSMLTNEVPLSKLAGNASTYAMAFQYDAAPKWTMSWGGGYTDMSFNDMDGYYTSMGAFEVVLNDNYNVNMGCVFKASDKIKVNAGWVHTFYSTDQKVKAMMAMPLDVDVIVNSSINVVALGVDLTF